MKKILLILSVACFIFGYSSGQSVPNNPSTHTFATIANLGAQAGSASGTKVNVLGFYAAGDGGGGEFYWDGTLTTTPVAGVIIQSASVATGRWVRIISDGTSLNIKWFGAYGDGSHFDSAAIAKGYAYAFANGWRRVYIPSGIYLTRSQAQPAYIEVYGDGLKSEFRFLASGNAAQDATTWTYISNGSGGLLHDVRIDGVTGSSYVIGNGLLINPD